ncbi:MAG: ATP-binding protein [Legionella sp.]|nr:ATP-binding protein [Legionella sp.]
MRDILETLLEEGFDTIAETRASVVRQLQFPKVDNIIKVAVGMRRSGKTYLLYQTIAELLERGVERERILLINFEDDRLLPMTAKEMGKLIDLFYTLYPQNHNRRCYLFLDEVQNVPEWQLVVRRYLDSKNVDLYLTGSSAKLLSKEIATSLRGRSLSIEVWPYSFNEFLQAHHISKPTQAFGQKTFDMMRQHLLHYFTKGGFPAVQHLPNKEWRETLQGYVDTVILRDIIERYGVSNIALLKYLTSFLIKNAATCFSVNKFYNDVKSQGYKVGKETIHTYLAYLEDAYLVFTVPFYSESERTKQNRPKKIYVVDNGLVNANALGTNDLYNKFLENQIYLDLRRQGKDVYFYHTADGYEIDFVSVDKDGSRELLQITVDLTDPKTAAREQRALEQAKKELGINGRIITMKDYLRSQRDSGNMGHNF